MTQKRGGGRVVALDALAAEERYAAEPIDPLTPDRCFQRHWALGMIDTAMNTLREQWRDLLKQQVAATSTSRRRRTSRPNWRR